MRNFKPRFNTEQAFEDCATIWRTPRNENRSESELSSEEKENLRLCDEGKEDVWDIVGVGCSWYCGGGTKSVSASSYLGSAEPGSYVSGNAHDLSYQTAWVEGAPGQGIGEYLAMSFQAKVPGLPNLWLLMVMLKALPFGRITRGLKSSSFI